MKPHLKNILSKETSPYLLQHAKNPIHWQVWNKETLQLAKDLERPILVSIGYAACHWCHVMEKESFEDEAIASFMNEHFINIKIDREERPDLDHIYMEALQLLTGSGGWPLNIFLTSDGKPFLGGTYFPPQSMHNRPSWRETIQFIQDIWKNRRSDAEKQANRLVDHLKTSGHLLFKKDIEITFWNNNLNTNYFEEASVKLLSNADFRNGGFGNAPKFPQLSTLQFMLNLYYHDGRDQLLNHVIFSLRKILTGGIYDQLAGGLSRYSTDEHWDVPHFEKMLYDNALLINLLSDAYQITKDIFYKEAIEDVVSFCIKELKSPEGGFYTSIDADSEGKEGSFYVWSKKEIDALLPENADLVCEWFGVTEKGNWEGTNIFRCKSEIGMFAKSKGMNSEDFISILKTAKEILNKQRKKRERPATDTKILLINNAMLVSALCKASAALNNKKYQLLAIELFSFIRDRMYKKGILFHSVTDKANAQVAFLDDYAYLIQASIHLQEITGHENYLFFAKSLTEYVIENFADQETGYFFYTDKIMDDVILRKHDLYDSPIPCGNSLMAQNLRYLSVVFENKQWFANSENTLLRMSDSIKQYPASMSNWGIALLSYLFGHVEIVITGTETEVQRRNVLHSFIPNKILISAEKEGSIILTKNKNYSNKGLIYICKNNQCYSPVEDFNAISHFHSGLTFSKLKKE